MKFILTTFWLIFLAELGDKTQLATMLMATKSESVWQVFIASAAALTLSSFLGVTCGSFIARHIPQHYIQMGAGFGFLIIGILLLSGKL